MSQPYSYDVLDMETGEYMLRHGTCYEVQKITGMKSNASMQCKQDTVCKGKYKVIMNKPNMMVEKPTFKEPSENWASDWEMWRHRILGKART